MFSDWLHKWLSCGFTFHACPHRHYPYLSFAGIKIILDFVPNHTSDQHEWFLRSEAGDPKYENFYIWHDGLMVGDERKPPNNWISVFRGPAWEWSEKRQQFYFHQFAKQQVRDLDFNFFFFLLSWSTCPRHFSQPDLNFRNPAVVEEMKNVLRFWLDKGVAGFRCDAVSVLLFWILPKKYII